MSITTVHDKDHKDEKTVAFPWIGIDQERNLIVLFSARGEGVVLGRDRTCHPIGYYGNSWTMASFKPLPEGEKVVLQNKWEWGNAE